MKVIDFKDAKCRHCYKCVRNCAVKAISVKDEQARIMVDHCINCGRCLEVCPQNAKQIRNDVDQVKSLIAAGDDVYVSLAPSYAAWFQSCTAKDVENALSKLGFRGVFETAIGAQIV